MPLRDHFHSPINDRHRWDAVHGQWPAEMVRTLFELLPEGYQAEPNIHLGSPFEVDISTLRDIHFEQPENDNSNVATLMAIAPTLTVQTELTEPDLYEVLVYDSERGRQLVAAIEIVSPSNKERPDAREQFIHKVTTLLQKDVCVSIVDTVTNSRFNLYQELLDSLDRNDPLLSPTPTRIYAVSLRLRQPIKGKPILDAWFYPMTVGQPLPSIPLWLNHQQYILLPLESSYQETCRLLRIP